MIHLKLRKQYTNSMPMTGTNIQEKLFYNVYLPVGGDVAAPHVVVRVDHVVLHPQQDVFLLASGAGGDLDVRVRHERVRVDFRHSGVGGRLGKQKNNKSIPCRRSQGTP